MKTLLTQRVCLFSLLRCVGSTSQWRSFSLLIKMCSPKLHAAPWRCSFSHCIYRQWACAEKKLYSHCVLCISSLQYKREMCCTLNVSAVCIQNSTLCVCACMCVGLLPSREYIVCLDYLTLTFAVESGCLPSPALLFWLTQRSTNCFSACSPGEGTRRLFGF